MVPIRPIRSGSTYSTDYRYGGLARVGNILLREVLSENHDRAAEDYVNSWAALRVQNACQQ